MGRNDQNNPKGSGSRAVQILLEHVKDGTLGDIWQDWKWILSFTRGHRVQILLYTLLGIFASALSLLTGVVSKYLIDCIIAFDRSRLLPLAGAVVLSGILSLGAQSLAAAFATRMGVAMRCDVQGTVFRQLLSARWLELRQFSTGDLLSRFEGDVTTVANCAVSWVPNMIIQIFTVAATLLVVLYYDPIMALIAFASTPVLFFVSRWLMGRQRDFNRRMRQVSSGMAAFEADVFRNTDTLKSFGVEEQMNQKLRFWQRDYHKIVLEHGDFSIMTNILLSAMGTAVQYLALGYCLWQLWSGKILVGTMVLFLQQRAKLSGAFSSLISLIPTALSGSVAAERLRELTELEKEQQEPAVQAVGSCAVTLENVCAAYEDGRQVLQSASFQAPAGKTVALVGPSGEGKSTLIRVMLGLIPPDSGAGWLTDGEGNRIPLGSGTRHLFAYVPQGNTLLAGTVAENLRLVNSDATEAQMQEALKIACAWDFVSALPLGIHNPIGEGGKGLSEGQAQRIAIARALMREAPVMLLDEVTSALDPDTERQVLENLRRRGVTCIAATHRSSILPLCAGVYRVREGRVQKLEGKELRQLTGNEIV